MAEHYLEASLGHGEGGLKVLDTVPPVSGPARQAEVKELSEPMFEYLVRRVALGETIQPGEAAEEFKQVVARVITGKKPIIPGAAGTAP